MNDRITQVVGTPLTVNVDEVETLVPGSSVTVSAEMHGTNLELDFGIPRGTDAVTPVLQIDEDGHLIATYDEQLNVDMNGAHVDYVGGAVHQPDCDVEFVADVGTHAVLDIVEVLHDGRVICDVEIESTTYRLTYLTFFELMRDWAPCDE